jgi:hypothetical protein
MKKIGLILLIATLLTLLIGCGNYDTFDTVYEYDRAIIQLANGEVIEVEVASWSDYEGEQIQITTPDGTVYLTSSLRCDLIKDPE